MDQAKDVIEATLQLEAAERARVATRRLANAEKSGGGDLSPAWEAAVDRRLAKIASGASAYVSADEIVAPGEAVLGETITASNGNP
jgi:hypothetical protein